MNKIKIFDAEYRFMNIIWNNEPVKSSNLVKIASKELGWKKSTTYTVIRRLRERNAIVNKDSTITSLVKRKQVMKEETEEHIDKIYDGSLKLFFTTFLQSERLKKDEIEELRKIVCNYKTKEE
ncbi:MAG: BlaI/MecI/CopY family transcriptional regulator [Clostridia bacterium]|nr:BlaI/MecI/CopY family transcriptional regulator [Clostridia bacterium]